jgi:type I restriction enzyme S subunit
VIFLTKHKETEIGKIPEDWEVKFLKDISDILTGFPFKGEEYSLDEGILVVRGENLSYRKFRWDIPKRWRFLNDSVKKYLLKENLVVVSMDGNVGVNKAITRKKDLPLLLAQRVAAIIAKKEECQDFINQVIMSDLFLKYCNQIKTGTTINHISKVQIESFKIPYPNNIKEQKAIAKILSDLDSKIELNNQMNATLEAMAQAIFKHWFIDFEFPNENGKPYKSSGGKMVDSELGKIPEGWKVEELGSSGSFKNGVNYIRGESGNKEFYIVNVRDISNSRFLLKGGLDKVRLDAIKAKEYLLQESDIVIARSACPGEISMMANSIDNVIYSGFSIRYRLNTQNNWLYMFLALKSLKQRLSTYAVGTTLTSVNQESLKKLKYILPPEGAIKKFNNTVEKSFEKLFVNLNESEILSQTRDSLLPKLMSGKIRVQMVVSK